MHVRLSLFACWIGLIDMFNWTHLYVRVGPIDMLDSAYLYDGLGTLICGVGPIIIGWAQYAVWAR